MVFYTHPSTTFGDPERLALTLDRFGNGIFNQNLSQGSISNCDVAVNSSGRFVCSGSSDRDLKRDITNISSADALDQINNLEGKTFTYRPEANLGDEPQIGFIAQDLQEIFPKEYGIVGRSNDHLYVNYSKLTAVLAEAIQELDEKVEDVEIESSDRWKNENMKEAREPAADFIAAVGVVLESFADDIAARFERVFADQVVAEKTLEAGEEICIDGECLDKETLRALIDSIDAGADSVADNGSNNDDGKDQLERRDENTDDNDPEDDSSASSSDKAASSSDSSASSFATSSPSESATTSTSTASSTDESAQTPE